MSPHRLESRPLAASIFLYSVAVPVESLHIHGIPGSISVLPAAGLIIIWLFTAALNRGAISVTPLLPWLAAFLGWTTMTALWSLDPARSVEWVRTMFLVAVVMAVSASVTATWRMRSRAMWGYLVGAVVVAILTLRAAASGQYVADFDQRAVTLSQDPNVLAVIMALALPIAFYLYTVTSSKFGSSSLVCSIPLIVLAVLVTGSRTGLIAVVFALAMAVFGMRGVSRTRRLLVLVAVATGAVFLPRAVDATVSDRLLATRHLLLEGDLNNRENIWASAEKLIADRPVQGWGINAFPTALERVSGAPDASHNVFIGAAVETGVIGFLLLLVLLAIPVRAAIRQGPRALWLGLAGVWLAGALTLTLTGEKITWWLVALAASCMTGPSRVDARRLVMSSNLIQAPRGGPSVSHQLDRAQLV